MTCLDDVQVLGLVEGRLPPASLADIDAHLDDCATCRELVTVVAGAPMPVRVLARGETIGRYVIGELLGTGAMGRVYSAWEPELDRRVAIKVLRDQGAGSRERLVREAQAMARVVHPNVVTVHEVGATDAGVFVAMELVEGETLRAWAQASRSPREIVPVLIEIARGLAAVHATGVIHRDIKPDNVIVGADGRVRLGDFGLARKGEARPALATGSVELDASATSIAGTPAYMAPEVLRGRAADAASDQFSFGVLAYELLAGTRPFAGTTWAELVHSIDRDDVRAPRGAPSWLTDTILRCLAVDPTKRFPSIAAVADQLEARAARRRPAGWIAGALVVGALASAATWLAVRGRDSAGASCTLAAEAWDAPTRDRLATALGARDDAARTATLTALDRWATEWRVERTATCALEPSPRVAARERCLAARRAEHAALVDRLARTDARTDRAVDAIDALSPPSECRAAEASTADPRPLDPIHAAAVRDVEAGLPTLRATIELGDPRTAVPEAEALVARARAGEHAPTLAEALLAHAFALRAASRLPDAAVAARDAIAAAERGRADEPAARAWLARLAIAGDRRELELADDTGALAEAAIERAGSPPRLRAMLARMRGLVAYNRGRLAEARERLEQARALVGATPSLELATIESSLGSVARAAGELDVAERHHRAALAIDRELRGAAHPDIARDLHNIAGVYRLRGDHDQALATYREALAIEIATQGETSVAAGLTHNSIGLVLLATNALPAARAELELALRILTTAGHGDRGFAQHNLGLVAQAAGDHRAALAHFQRAEVVYTSTIGMDAEGPARLAADRATSERALAKLATRRPTTESAASHRATTASPAPPAVATPTAPAIATPSAPAKPEPGKAATTPATPAKPAKPVQPPPNGVYGSSQTW